MDSEARRKIDALVKRVGALEAEVRALALAAEKAAQQFLDLANILRDEFKGQG